MPLLLLHRRLLACELASCVPFSSSKPKTPPNLPIPHKEVLALRLICGVVNPLLAVANLSVSLFSSLANMKTAA